MPRSPAASQIGTPRSADEFWGLVCDYAFAMLWLVRPKDYIIDRLASLIATDQIVGIEVLADRILCECRARNAPADLALPGLCFST
jgi:hypothetical protein